MLKKVDSERLRVDEEYQEEFLKYSEWRKRIAQLEHKVILLNDEFEFQYGKRSIPENLPVYLQEIMENRREGLRLSVKTTSKLMRKLKPLQQIDFDEASYVTQQQSNMEVMDKTDGQGEEATMKENDSTHPEDTLPNKDLKQDSDLNEVNTDDELIPQKPIVEELVNSGETKDYTEVIQQNSNNQEVLNELKDINHKTEKKFFNFMEKGVAPILDGLYNGQKHAGDLERDISEESEECKEEVRNWLEIYHLLSQRIKDIFQTFSFTLLTPEVGEPFDENQHDPIAVVEDLSFLNEQIKEVVRVGLLYTPQSFIVRPAQVIVVKNVEVMNEEVLEDGKEGAQADES
ncbi:nucleotide exchange factor GrpE [Alkalihalobacillus sp. R86527]|uniref:nucleotide exchange factor GrpE n=1 Tax=Alkalihalobacillus sp. R86527 TaxID=3093863 RepID=UPI00366E3BE4